MVWDCTCHLQWAKKHILKQALLKLTAGTALQTDDPDAWRLLHISTDKSGMELLFLKSYDLREKTMLNLEDDEK